MSDNASLYDQSLVLSKEKQGGNQSRVPLSNLASSQQHMQRGASQPKMHSPGRKRRGAKEMSAREKALEFARNNVPKPK